MAKKLSLVDGSMIITEALVKAGADMFIGYPITPSNRFYAYGKDRYPLFFAAPDEITVLQWMSGAAATGKLPVTATAFPGLALMVESINMAYVMELPMVIILTQRLGPSTGSATAGAQGDLSFINGIVPGFPIPTFCPGNFNDCWTLAHKAAETAVHLRTPVLLLTSKEMVMTSRSFDLDSLQDLSPVKKVTHESEDYRPIDLVNMDLPPGEFLGNSKSQVRFNSSMHNKKGRIVKNDESLGITAALRQKIVSQANELSENEYWQEPKAETLIVSYGVSALAAMDAWLEHKKNNIPVSLLTLKTLIPLSEKAHQIIRDYKNVVIVEENINGQLTELMFGLRVPENIRILNKFGKMITPSEILTATH